jgi:hypothetical protein
VPFLFFVCFNQVCTCHTVQIMPDAHDSELQCVEYCEELDEIATSGMGNKVGEGEAATQESVRIFCINISFNLLHFFACKRGSSKFSRERSIM